MEKSWNKGPSRTLRNVSAKIENPDETAYWSYLSSV